ncbi:MAG TPA: flagellar basal body rod C-terminal domain-containing protein [Humidesulfovibrio sp.]|uniref:flagellar basal body rod C-terminal domain-containing protein n=1 Tax=Humidesulfovibrio sp. TaxID=2910988 RepID=UPI002C17691A|nr:flagellar basal body rod C-terminal domain-containing protein [Humidesulfovibrio sp.]HWR05091.1 flagellar basal body rod C-terminal domain-containing protein [Humidesulfovibrio sp.]
MSIESSSSVQALSAFGVALDATAHNIANVSTGNYQPLRAEFADGPGGQGVQVAAVNRAGSGAESVGPGATGAGASEGPGAGLQGVSSLLGQGNGVDIATEMVGLMQIERAYSANAKVISTVEQTTGRVMDLIA